MCQQKIIPEEYNEWIHQNVELINKKRRRKIIIMGLYCKSSYKERKKIKLIFILMKSKQKNKRKPKYKKSLFY